MRGKIIQALRATWALIAHGSLPLLEIEVRCFAGLPAWMTKAASTGCFWYRIVDQPWGGALEPLDV